MTILWRAAEESDHLDDLPWIARGLAANELWGDDPVTIVVRPAPNAALAVIGCFDAVQRARLDELAARLISGNSPVRYVGYRQAEADCAALADKLLERLPPGELESFRWVGLPRGGLVVLGMLAYVLDLPPASLTPPERDEPVVIVDDCALSGLRFRGFLERYRQEGRAVVFAHLYSHPALRAAIEATESAVCISARDLSDLAPDLAGQGYAQWRRRWEELAPGAYWIGRTEALAFAWNEPDFAVWNPVTGQVEAGWHLVPPEACLKHRRRPGARVVPVEIQPRPTGALSHSPNVVFGTLEGRVVIGDAAAGEAVVLDEVAGAMWRVLLTEPTREAAVRRLGGTFEASAEVIRADLDRFTTDLVQRGLLVSRP